MTGTAPLVATEIAEPSGGVIVRMIIACSRTAIVGAKMARPKRFELLTPRFVVWCSIQLSYGRARGIARGSGLSWQGPGPSASPALSEGLRVFLRLETNEEFAAGAEHRALDHRGLRGHERKRLLLVQSFLILRRQRTKGAAGAVEQGLPADRARPAFERGRFDARALVVMKLICDAVLLEPRARLLHRVAVL